MNLYKKTALFTAMFLFVAMSYTQLPIPELILENDGLELDDSFTVNSWDEPVDMNNVEVERFVDAEVFNPFGLILLDFDSEGHRHYNVNDGYIINFNNETAVLIAHVVDGTDQNQGFSLYSQYNQGMDWDNFSNQTFPTDYKDDNDLAGDNYLNWRYFYLSQSSYLYGTGGAEGTLFHLNHQPSSLYYGAQIGMAAGNLTPNRSTSCWFNFSGDYYLNGELHNSYEGIEGGGGDFGFDLEPAEVAVVLRHYSVTDEFGNVTNQSTYVIIENPELGCIDPTSCSFSSSAQLDDGSCLYFDNCGICGGDDNCPTNYCQGDLTNDGEITSADLSAVLSNFGCMDSCPADLNGDGATTVSDVTKFLTLIGKLCE